MVLVTGRNRWTSSVASRLPPELTDAIIDGGKDDKPFLKTCSLVCRAWVPASRRHLFRRVVLWNPNTVEFCRLVESELVTFPRHIRCLRIYSHPFVLGNTRRFKSHIIGLLEHGIGYFRSLTELDISDCKINSFNDLANALLSCVILESLSFVEVSWRHVSGSVPVAGSLPSLRRLNIRYLSDPKAVTSWLLSMQPIPALASFTFYDCAWTAHHLHLVNTVIQTLGPSLRYLDIDDWGGAPSSVSLVDLSHNTELHTLIVDLNLFRSSPNVIKSFLGSVCSSIQVLTMNVSLLENWNQGASESLDLRNLDQFFCQQFPDLQAISLRLHDLHTYEEVDGMIKLNMTQCLSRGILSTKTRK